MKPITLIMAHAADGAIGHDGGLPWPHHSEDMRRFREATLGEAVIMGRRTWESLPKPLPYRHNIVVTSNPSRIDGTKADAVRTIEEAIEAAGESHPFFIGGRGIFTHSLVYVNHFLLTTISGRWPADVYFKVPFLEGKTLVSQEEWEHPTDPSLNCTFSEYVNKP